MATQENNVRVLCPYCKWQATGTNVEELRKAKELHGAYECPGDGVSEKTASVRPPLVA